MEERIDVEHPYWLSLLSHGTLGILTDLDGALIPFAPRPELARPNADLISLVDELADQPGVTLAIVSGRPRGVLDEFFPGPHKLILFAEHGGWRREGSKWERAISADEHAIDAVFADVSALSAKIPGVILERKTWSLAVHFRTIPSSARASFLVELTAGIQPWLDAHTDFEPLWGAEVLEIRPIAARKSIAVEWMRRAHKDVRLLVVGDDTTDEDMFAATDDRDATILVDPEAGRATHARWRVDSTDEVRAFYRDIIALRKGALTRPAQKRVRAAESSRSPGVTAYRLLVISNRLPEFRSAEAAPSRPQKKNVGGLVSALRPVLEAREGIWLGWSGRIVPGREVSDVGRSVAHGLAFASVDFPEDWHRHYYNGLSNGALWPLLHSFPSRVRFSHADWKSYVEANQAFAEIATRLVARDATLWVHDYHLFLMASTLRARGHTGPIGFFQHVPFPGPDLFFVLPWAEQILESMLDFDLVGFHTRSYVDNFLRCMAQLPDARIEGDVVIRGNQRVRAAVFALGIMPEEFQESSEDSDEIGGMIRVIRSMPIVLGVDRLDYTKGIPERIDAFGRMLQIFPEWRRKVCLVQVSVPSRADVRDYAEQRTRVENSVGRVNGEFGTADWVPIRYLYRSYGRAELTQLYRVAAVGYVTPLRDGMNLVAKEFVAAQDPESPGVLLLSRFAGAAEELRDAMLTNPWDTEGTARDLDRALRMPLEERKIRHEKLQRAVSKTTALTWAEDFLSALAKTRA